MKTIILAAGRSPRLMPLTKNTPKSLLKIGGNTILEKQVQTLKEAGITDITVVTGYLSEKLEEHCEELKVKSLLNPFYNVSGMALTLWLAKEEIRKGFLFLYADVMFKPETIKGLLKTKEDICLSIKKNGLREEAEKVVEKDGILKGISKDALSKENGEFIGLAKFSEKGAGHLIEELDNIAREDINGSFINAINRLIKNGKTVAAYDIKDAEFADIDFPEDLENARKLFG